MGCRAVGRENGTVDLATAVLDQLAAAQAVLDLHVADGSAGRCLCCAGVAPCPEYERAAATFARYRRLPQRKPGATRPELAKARRLTPLSTVRAGYE